jgi:hypothetical protein
MDFRYTSPSSYTNTVLNSYSQNIVTDGLVLYLDARKKESYPGTGKIWYDLSPTGLNLTGVRDTGISSIDGVNSLGGAWTSASTSILNDDTHSIFFNIKFNSTELRQQASSGNWEKIFGYTPTGTDRSPGIWRWPSNRYIHWKYDPANTGAEYFNLTSVGASAGTEFVLNTWYYIGVVKNAGTMYYYVNGVNIGNTVAANPKTSGNSTISIFPDYTFSSSNVDNVQIYSRPITDAEVASNYEASKNRFLDIPTTYLIVGGGGGGGMDMGGGGGAGGYLAGSTNLKLNKYYGITVGVGGWGAPGAGESRGDGIGPQTGGHVYSVIPATKGLDSVLSGIDLSLVAVGGGSGGSSYRGHSIGITGGNGGSGGGSSGYNDNAGTFLGGVATTGQGNRGGNSGTAYYSGGGGGAAAAGADSTNQADGGAGVANDILGTNYYWAGGGGGSGYSREGGNGGIGGGGAGAVGSRSGGGSALNNGQNANGNAINSWANVPGGNGGENTGGGGGGGSHYNASNRGGIGGSGIVVLRYPNYYPDLKIGPGLNFKRINVSGYKIYSFLSGTGSIICSTTDVFTQTVDYLVVGGGGGGGSYVGGGGGGGGVVPGSFPLQYNKTFTVTVGAGGSGGTGVRSDNETNGSDSSLSGGGISITGIGGGRGARYPDQSGYAGGSGGGHGGSQNNGASGGRALQPTSTSGGNGSVGSSSTATRPNDVTMGGGGGGADTSAVNNSANAPGDAGAGIYNDITGTGYYWGAGGGGGSYNAASSGSPARSGNGGIGGGGNGGCFGSGTVGTIGTGGINSATQTAINAGTTAQGVGGAGGANTGSGGGGCGHSDRGGNGGSGTVIIAYPDTFPALSSIAAELTYTQPSRAGYRVYMFTAGTGAISF